MIRNFDIKRFLGRNSIWIVFIALSIFMTFASETFLTRINITNLLTTNAIVGIMAVGVAFCIISRGIDLSTASVLALSSVVTASLVQEIDATNKVFEGMVPIPAFYAVLAGLGVGLFFGLMNGLLIAYTKIPPFIATLGSMLITRAAAQLYTSAFPVPGLTPEFRSIGQGEIIPLPYFSAGSLTTFGVPNVVTAFIVIVIIGGFFLTQTRFGQNIYAIGGNDTAARVAGINVEINIVKIYVFSSVCSAFAGVLLASRVGSGNATLVSGGELDAIAAATVGGVSHAGGIGRISGVIAGILVLGVVNNGMLLLGISPYVQNIVKGVIIICAVVFDMRRNARRA